MLEDLANINFGSIHMGDLSSLLSRMNFSNLGYIILALLDQPNSKILADRPTMPKLHLIDLDLKILHIDPRNKNLLLLN